MRRVVVTGLGMVSPLADGVEATWERLLEGQSGAGPCLLYTSPSPRDVEESRMPSSA